MPRNLKPDLAISAVEDWEILHVIGRYYGSARSTERSDVIYPNQDNYCLKIHQNYKGIVSIEPGPAFSAGELDTLKERITREAADSAGIVISQNILFSSRPVKGSFGSKIGDFRIIPAPLGAPRPGQLYGDHPFVFEFPIKKSSEWSLTVARKMKVMTEWTWILNALLKDSIKCVGPRLRNQWCITLNDQRQSPTQSQVHWGQEFYMIDNFTGISDSFTPLQPPSAPIVSHREYYSASDSGSQELVLPESLDNLVGAISHLSVDDRERFLRAVQWRYVANENWHSSMSSFYIALVAAIEALIPLSTGASSCPQCGKDLGPGPTQRFKAFVDQYAPQGGEVEVNRKRLYNIRSDLAHGWNLFSYDRAPWDFNFNTTALLEQEAIDRLQRIIRIVIINWLLGRS